MTIESEESIFKGIRGQVAVVTGASRGLGRVYAAKLARLGARVVLLARNLDQLQEAVRDIRADGGEAMCIQTDVMDRSSVAAAFSQIDQCYDHVDLLINNAGNLGTIGSSWEVDAAEWWNTLELHLLGSFLCLQEAFRRMIPHGGGRIINLVSNAGVYRWPHVSAYSVAKAALTKLTENVAVEAKQRGVLLFAFHPGVVRGLGLGETQIQASLVESAEIVGPELRGVREWIIAQSVEGQSQSVTAEQGADMLARLASGHYDFLNGRYVTVHDDLAELSLTAEQIRKSDALTLRVLSPRSVEKLPAGAYQVGLAVNEAIELLET